MKKNVLFLLMFVFLLSFYGCGDSIYSDAADTGTYEAKQDQLDFDFISNNCAPVIDYYNNVDSSGASLTRDQALLMYMEWLQPCLVYLKLLQKI